MDNEIQMKFELELQSSDKYFIILIFFLILKFDLLGGCLQIVINVGGSYTTAKFEFAVEFFRKRNHKSSNDLHTRLSFF